MARRKKRRRGRHDEIVSCLEERLKWSGRYDSIRTHVEYARNGYCGEFDVITKSPEGYVHYYEVKSRFSVESYRRALTQFERAAKAFPEFKWKFIYYSPEHTLRVKISDTQ